MTELKSLDYKDIRFIKSLKREIIVANAVSILEKNCSFEVLIIRGLY